MQKLFVLFLFLTSILSCFAQNNRITGRVIDADSRVSLPFVNIVINDGFLGGTTDIDGKFNLVNNNAIDSLKLTYIGYETLIYQADPNKKNHVIKLQKTEYELPEYVVYPTENPAHRIINNVIASRDKNDPEKLPSFTYTSYDKVVFTLELDSLPSIDSITSDTTDDFRRYLEDHHLFMMESVVERKFRSPDNNEEKVIATKVSGLQDPIFVFLLSQLQSNSFYANQFDFLGQNFENPISRGSTRKYFFLLQDTIYSGESDTTFIISFRPGLNTNFSGLKGTLSINTKNWAVQNVIAEPAKMPKGIGFRIEQLYELIDSTQWFPVQLNTEFIALASITDSTVSLTMGGASEGDSVQGKLTYIPIGTGRSYIKDIVLNPEIKKREFTSFEIEVDPEASHRDENFWMGYRVDSLSQKEANTYQYLDSLGKAERFDFYAQGFESFMAGKIPWGKFDLDIDRFMRYNPFEGFAPGAGVHTNRRFSEVFKIGGYFRYGFKDHTFKYGGDANLLLHANTDFRIGIDYMKDVSETSGVSFWDDNQYLLNPKMYRDFLIRRMDDTERLNMYTGIRPFKFTNLHFGLVRSNKMVTNNYQYLSYNEGIPETTNQFDFTEIVVGVRYAYGEKFIKNARRIISMGTDFPVLWFQYTRGLDGFWNGQFDYNRYDVKIEKSFYTNYIGKTSIKLAGGYIDSDIPYTNLYNGNGSYYAFTLYAQNSFGTMRLNEFLSNKYAALYFQHDFEKLIAGEGFFTPELAIVTNIGFGWLDFKESHEGIDYKTMEHGFYESGILLNNLLNLQLIKIGVGGFYRYGPYSFDKVWDNMGLKLTVGIALERD